MARACCKYLTVSLVPTAALFLAVVFGLGTLTLPILFSQLTKKIEYGVVIDAGSSHTTLYLYEVEVPLNGKVRQIHFIKVNDHLDNYASKPTMVGDMVKKLISDSFSRDLPQDLRVPDDLINSTHVYVGATAGMRLLKLKNESVTGEILHQVTKAVRSLKPLGYFMEERTRIISGMEEAAGGWATSNYLMNTLHSGSMGSLDMGGASTEIAFKVNKSHLSEPFYTNEVLFNRTYPVYARSYLCYGHIEAAARFLGHLVFTSNHNGNVSALIPNPCHPAGFKSNLTFSSINTSCVVDPISEEIFGSALKLSSNYSANSTVLFIGTGNYEQCLGNISAVFNFSSCNPHLNCPNATRNFSVPPSEGSFIAYSGFHYIARKFGLVATTFNNTGCSFSSVFKHKCEKTLNATGSETMCFYGILMAHMMEKGFGFSNSSTLKWEVIFKNKHSGINFGWSLGYLMNRTTEDHYRPEFGYDAARPFTAVDLVVGMIILSLLCAIFVIFFFLTFYACKKALEAHNGYQSIS